MNYTSPANVRIMAEDLALLPAWYAEDGDYVLVDAPTTRIYPGWLPAAIQLGSTAVSTGDLKNKSLSLPHLEAEPWGLSQQSLHLFDGLRQAYELDIDLPVWKDEYVALTGRQTAADCLVRIQQALPDIDFPPPPVFLSQIEEIEEYLSQNTGEVVLKTPYSSSGRGLLWLTDGRLSESDRNVIKGMLRTQNVVSLEHKLKKDVDFAIEFYSDGKGNVYEKGASLFLTTVKGAYKCNLLMTQDSVWGELAKFGADKVLDRVRETMPGVLRDVFGSKYTGYLGVDMIIHKVDGGLAFHPCVEINLRRTMGMVAINLVEKYIGKHAMAIFDISYELNPGKAYERHQLMKKTYPPVFLKGKLQKGYFSLCPVTKETHYTAFVQAR
jgi:hypothetical protein